MKDRVISILVGVAIAIPIVAGLIAIINVGGEYFWFYVMC